MTTERSIFTPRTIAKALSERAQAFSHQLGTVLRKTLRGLRALRVRMAQTAQYHREIELLMHADDRILADIGLTRYDVIAAAQESRGWFGRRDALRAAATRRDEAIAASGVRRKELPHAEAPSLAPTLPSAMETSNFR